MNIDNIRQEFQNPSNQYRIMPLFIMNDKADRKRIDEQIKSLKEQGCGGVFAYRAYFDWEDDRNSCKFLSDEWFETYDMIAEACVREGMELWVYDEEEWPSGSAGGQLSEKHPETCWKYLHLEEHYPENPGSIEIPIGEGIFVSAVAYCKQGSKIVRDSILDLKSFVKDEKLIWNVPAGLWTIAIYTARYGIGLFLDTYGDLMDEHAMSLYRDMVYKSHFERTQKTPGAQLKGFFTDEPHFSHAMAEFGDRFTWYPSMPYTPALAETFKARYGYEIEPNLPLLYYDAGADSMRFRCHYWETCLHLYTENYFGQLYRYCEEKGMKFTGHLVVEELFRSHLSCQAGNLPTHYRYMHIPGIDWIHPFDGFKTLPCNTPKYASSMSHLMGRERTWAESFAASGWGMTFQQARHVVNFEHINGINMQIPITYRYSLRGKRVTSYSPSITYQQPYWDHFRGFADYEARMCVLASGSGHIAQIALGYPEVDIWCHCWDHDLLDKRSKAYNHLGDIIRVSGYDYDILDDRALLEQSRIDNGEIITDTECFEILIMPHMDGVRRSVMEYCRIFAASGGTVIFMTDVPRHSFEYGSDDPKLAELMKELLGCDCYSIQNKLKPSWNSVGKGRVGLAPDAEDAVRMMREVSVPDVVSSTVNRSLLANHREFDDADLYMLFNNTYEAQTITVTLKSSGYPERWDPVTGKIEGITDYEITPECTRLTLDFSSQEIIAVVIRRDSNNIAEADKYSLVSETVVKGMWDFRIEETMTRLQNAWNFDQETIGWHKLGIPAHVPDKIPLGDWCQYGLAAFSGLGHYEKDIELGDISEDNRIILDLGGVGVSAEVFVNGSQAGIVFFEPWQLDITKYTKPGNNHLHIIVANTLSNHYSQFEELAGNHLSQGNDFPERRISGLLGPVRLLVMDRAYSN